MNEEISKAIEHLNNGGVILYPCDTIWGMGCDATNQEAVNCITLTLPNSDSLVIVVPSRSSKLKSGQLSPTLTL